MISFFCLFSSIGFEATYWIVKIRTDRDPSHVITRLDAHAMCAISASLFVQVCKPLLESLTFSQAKMCECFPKEKQLHMLSLFIEICMHKSNSADCMRD